MNTIGTGDGQSLTVYGADWCHVTRDTLRYLDERGVTYAYVNVDHDVSASEWVKRQNDGLEIKPTLHLGGTVLTAPAPEALESALRAHCLLPSE